MRAIDTNVVVRILVADDPGQTEKATAVVEAGNAFVSATVILECEWVLRSAYGLSRDQVLHGLRHFAGLRGVVVENPSRLSQALDLAAEGVDLADALHLVGAEGCTAFLSFDRRLRLAATGRSPIPVEEP